MTDLHPLFLVDIDGFSTVFPTSDERALSLLALDQVTRRAAGILLRGGEPFDVWPRAGAGDGWAWPLTGQPVEQAVRFALAVAEGLEAHARESWECLPLSARFAVAWGWHRWISPEGEAGFPGDLDSRSGWRLESEALQEAEALLGALRGASPPYALAWTRLVNRELSEDLKKRASRVDFNGPHRGDHGYMVRPPVGSLVRPPPVPLPAEQGDHTLVRVQVRGGTREAFRAVWGCLLAAAREETGIHDARVLFRAQGVSDGWFLDLRGLHPPAELGLLLRFGDRIREHHARFPDLPLRVRVAAGRGRVQEAAGQVVTDGFIRLQRFVESTQWESLPGDGPWGLVFSPAFRVHLEQGGASVAPRTWSPLAMTDKHGFPHPGYVLSPPPSTAPTATDRVAGRYRLLKELGRGSYGVVFAARDEREGRDVALKRLHLSDHGPKAVERFLVEGRLLEGLDHPNIVRCYDRFQEGEHAWLVLQLCRGGTLLDALASGPLPAGDVVDCGLQVLCALTAVHARGLVHRDVKPHNLFLDDAGSRVVLRLGDFGIAHVPGQGLTRSGFPLGTPGYMAPEQIHDASNVTPGADLYAVAATLWHAATGRTPDRLWLHQDDPRTFSGLPPALARVLRRALAEIPGDRFPSAGEMAEALGGVG